MQLHADQPVGARQAAQAVGDLGDAAAIRRVERQVLVKHQGRRRGWLAAGPRVSGADESGKGGHLRATSGCARSAMDN